MNTISKNDLSKAYLIQRAHLWVKSCLHLQKQTHEMIVTSGTMSALTGNLIGSNLNTAIPELRTSNQRLEKNKLLWKVFNVFNLIH